MREAARAGACGAAALLVAAGARAQEVEPISPEDFLALVEGRTIVVADPPTGMELARETFLGREATDYRLADGTCLQGIVTTPGSQVCFDYGLVGGPSCWWFARVDGRLMARSAPLVPGVTVEIADVVDEPVSCGAPPLS